MPFREIAKIAYGIKSGADEFFYVQDITEDMDNSALAEVYGLTRDQTADACGQSG